MDKITGKLETDIYVRSARSLGLQVAVLDKESGFCSLYDRQRELLIKGSYTGLTNAIIQSALKDSKTAEKLFGSISLPISRQLLLSLQDTEKIIRFMNDHKPVLLKTISGSTIQAIGHGPLNEGILQSCLENEIKLGRSQVRLEKLFSDNVYRILIYRGEIIGVVKKTVPTVTGDGRSTLEELIIQKNTKRKERRLKPIRVEGGLFQNITTHLKEVVPDKERVTFSPVPGPVCGGETKRIKPASLHADARKIFLDIARTLHVDFCGIDVVIPGPDKAATDNQMTFLGVTTCPNISLHYFAGMKENMREARKILKRYFHMSTHGFIIKGKVQRVRYRKTLKENCVAGGFNGYVKNLADGSVLAAVLCQEHRLKEFSHLLEKGSRRSQVEMVEPFRAKPVLNIGFRIKKI